MTVHDHQFAQPIAQASLLDQVICASDALIRCRYAAFRDRFGITEIQCRILMQLAQAAPINLSQLAQSIDRDVAQISRTIRVLEERGLVQSGKRTGKQALAIELTGLGRTVQRQMARMACEMEQAVISQMSPADITLTHAAMERLRDAVRDKALRG